MKEEFSSDRSKNDGLTSACRACNSEREKKRRGNGGDFTRQQKQATFEKYGRFCQICGNISNLEVDHRLAQNISKANKASIEENAWILCKGCNIAKNTKILIEVIKEVPRKTLGPMLLPQYANRIVEGFFEKVTITIGGKQFTEVKFK
ncbi:hypothetical protein LG276_19855 [Cytobacillus kochii]|uniref:HNH endonuclease n=1 Tax=Cytobacillus kochii TaxID=859143 RepID=UPI00384FCBD6